MSSYGVRALARMKDTMSSMPPGNPLSAADIAVFEAWVTATPAMPEGMCGTIVGGSTDPTCASNQFELAPTIRNPHDGDGMAPGYACIACHEGQNFAGQNPGLSALDKVRAFMGTVFAAPHEKDLCIARLPVAATVEIYDGVTKALVTTMSVDPYSGNFRSRGSVVKPASYTAKLVTANGTREMFGAQTSGDCNTCHTVAGANLAPGRIYLP
jgi:hypothetical protein